MPASFEIEALKAQAIAVRSYTYKKLETKSHNDVNLCTDPNHCQAWKSPEETENYRKIVKAVEETEGKVATYDGKIINAVYHASSGGFTENAINVWSGQEDYLISVKSPKEEIRLSEVVVSTKDFLNKLKLKDSKKIEIKILSRTEGNRVKEISINKKIFTGNEIRKIFNLKSSNFEVFIKNADIKFEVKGYGHGVGLSQWGAQAMALEGKTCEEIIKHYYTGVEIQIV